MNTSFLGTICALLAIGAFGTYMVPLKRFPQLSPWNFLMHMAWGALLSSAIAAYFAGWTPFYWVGFFCGLVWTLGAGSIFSAVQKEDSMGGVTVRAMATSITVSFLMGTLYFRESIIWGIAVPAVLLLLGGLLVLDPGALKNPLRNWRSFAAGAVFGSYLAPYHPEIHGTARFMLPLTMGITLGSLLFFLMFRGKASVRETGASAGAGALWTLGSIACYKAVELLGFTVGYALSQLNLLVAIAWGMVAFGEFPTRPERMRVLGSAGMMIAGGALLSMARG